MKAQSKGEEKSKPKSRPTLAREDALDILTSAIGYCREAGLEVQAENTEAGVTLKIIGADVSDIGVQALFSLRPAQQVTP